MPEGTAHDKPGQATGAPDHEVADGKKPAGAHLERRQQRNTELTEKSKNDPGGAHSGSPDPTNP